MAEASADDGQGRFVLAAFAELFFGALAILLGYLIGPPPQAHIPRWSDGEGWIEGVAIGLGVGCVLAGMAIAASRLPFRSFHQLQQAMELRMREFMGHMTAIELAVLALTAGLGEELLFRGWIQQGLHGYFGSDQPLLAGVVGWLIASILFGLAHPITPLYIVLATVMGMALGGIYWLTGNLLCAIVAHAAYDAIILLKWKHEMDGDAPPGNST